MAETILHVLNRITPFLFLFFGIAFIYDSIRVRSMIAREEGVELSRTLGIRQTTMMLAEGVALLLGAIWLFASWLR